MAKLKVLEIPEAKWLHGKQEHPIQMASPHGMDIIGYLLTDLGIPRTHLMKHTAKDLNKLASAGYTVHQIEQLQYENDRADVTLAGRKRAIAAILKQMGYKVQWT
jgi:hypothetical protein